MQFKLVIYIGRRKAGMVESFVQAYDLAKQKKSEGWVGKLRIKPKRI